MDGNTEQIEVGPKATLLVLKHLLSNPSHNELIDLAEHAKRALEGTGVKVLVVPHWIDVTVVYGRGESD